MWLISVITWCSVKRLGLGCFEMALIEQSHIFKLCVLDRVKPAQEFTGYSIREFHDFTWMFSYCVLKCRGKLKNYSKLLFKKVFIMHTRLMTNQSPRSSKERSFIVMSLRRSSRDGGAWETPGGTVFKSVCVSVCRAQLPSSV